MYACVSVYASFVYVCVCLECKKGNMYALGRESVHMYVSLCKCTERVRVCMCVYVCVCLLAAKRKRIGACERGRSIHTRICQWTKKNNACALEEINNFRVHVCVGERVCTNVCVYVKEHRKRECVCCMHKCVCMCVRLCVCRCADPRNKKRRNLWMYLCETVYTQMYVCKGSKKSMFAGVCTCVLVCMCMCLHMFYVFLMDGRVWSSNTGKNSEFQMLIF